MSLLACRKTTGQIVRSCTDFSTLQDQGLERKDDWIISYDYFPLLSGCPGAFVIRKVLSLLIGR